ncbi:hypothetical protein JIQ88_05615 [Pseudomonas sp. PCH44]|uniref:hypothetical protein n=2 Tax=Pseudomonas TaxID=286 RepID=UPI001BB01AF0|nr:hypothetical protein [Pseudomonas sp. PCH44]
MALAEDNHIDPNNKARWGFGGNAGKITVGPQTVGETGGVESILTEPDNSGAHNNGGGTGDGEQVKQLQQANAQLAAEKEDLQKQLQALQKAEQDRLAAEKEEQDRLAAEKEVEELKAKLDAAGVTYRANASKESLQKLVEDLPK